MKAASKNILIGAQLHTHGSKKYLGKSLSPDNYYSTYFDIYQNSQADSVKEILTYFKYYIQPKILDVGCGAGLGTNILQKIGFDDCIGIDRSFEMINRYRNETKCSGFVLNFWDELPKADTAIVIHALHLCPPSRMWEFRWRLMEAGIKKIIVVSPLKRAIDNLNFELISVKNSLSGKSKKTVWGWIFKIK